MGVGVGAPLLAQQVSPPAPSLSPPPPQRRLQRHEEAALAKYYALDKRLRADPRLAMLLAPA